MKKHFLTLLCMLVVSSLLMAGLGAYIKYEVLLPLNLYQDKNIIELPFLMLTDEVLRYSVNYEMEKQEAGTKPEESTGSTESEESTIGEETIASEETTVTEDTAASTEPTMDVTEGASEPTQPSETATLETEPQVTEPLATEPQSPAEPVEISWFDDALFIGNSLAVGLRDFARLGNADYFCTVGMTVFDVMETWARDVSIGEVQLKYLLETNTYGKIYINLGLNEVGYQLDAFVGRFQELIDMIQELQPDAKIIIHGMIMVNRNKAKEAWYFGIDNLKMFNDAMKNMADGETIFYIDANEWIVDEEGYMPDEWSSDGCHPYATGYQEWAQWIQENAGTLGIP